MSNAILALDQSLSRTGWALHVDGCDLMVGSWPLADRPALRPEGFRQLFYHLDQMHKAHGLAEIIHEKPNFGAANQGEDQLIGQIGLIAVIELFACSRSVLVAAHYTQSWRTTWFLKHERKAIQAMPGKLREWKRRAVERAEQYGLPATNGDEAEACAILTHHLLTEQRNAPWFVERRSQISSII